MRHLAIGAADHRPAAVLFDTDQVLAELDAVVGRHAQKVGNDEHGKGLGEIVHELAFAARQKRVDLLIGKLPHEILVFLEASRRDQRHQKRPVGGVDWRVHRRQLVEEGGLVAELLDQLGNILVAMGVERNRAACKRSGGRHARGKALGIVINLERFDVTRDHDHALMQFAHDRALVAKIIEIRVRIVDEPVTPKEIMRLEIALRIAHIRSSGVPTPR